MLNHLVIFTLGPIQDFIASARRSRDLAYGSWLLSELSRTAACTVASRHNIDALIFPAPVNLAELEPDEPNSAGREAGTEKPGIANKIVAVVPGSADDTARLAQAVEDAVRRRLNALAAEVFDLIGQDKLDSRTTAAAQVADLLEFYWVARPLAADDTNYADMRRYLEALTAARKGTRDFHQLPSRPGFVKSSLDGIRESVIPKHLYPSSNQASASQADARKWQEKAQRLYAIYGAGPAEQLSGVDLLKRRGRVDWHFPSTSHFAALPFLRQLDKQAVKPHLDSFIRELDDRYKVKPDKTSDKRENAPLGEYDGSLLFASRLTEDVKRVAEKREIAQLLENFLQKIAPGARPQPYYALLHADGDHMGKTIDAQEKRQKHREISIALSRFAARVPHIVGEHEGATVYSGGDDVLAFLPLHTVLKCADKLADAFAEELNTFGGDGNPAPTLSTGIAIAHYLEPLSDALDLARQAEKEAKRVNGEQKHGLAITLSKRSGSDRTAGGPRKALMERLTQLVALHREKDAIPAGAAYQIQSIISHLGTPGSEDALLFETLRILERKSSMSDGTKQWLQALLSQAQVTPAELVNELIVAKFFADAQVLSERKVK